jgi:hypothetical protein
MACIRRRRGKWVVDYRDAAGVRRWITCETRRGAEAALVEPLRLAHQPARPVVDLRITLAAYTERWLGFVRATAKPRTYETYEAVLRASGPSRSRARPGRAPSIVPSSSSSWSPSWPMATPGVTSS